jgi:hypothetical protein
MSDTLPRLKFASFVFAVRAAGFYEQFDIVGQHTNKFHSIWDKRGAAIYWRLPHSLKALFVVDTQRNVNSLANCSQANDGGPIGEARKLADRREQIANGWQSANRGSKPGRQYGADPTSQGPNNRSWRSSKHFSRCWSFGIAPHDFAASVIAWGAAAWEEVDPAITKVVAIAKTIPDRVRGACRIALDVVRW